MNGVLPFCLHVFLFQEEANAILRELSKHREHALLKAK